MAETSPKSPLLDALMEIFEPHDKTARSRAHSHVEALLEAQQQGDTALQVSPQDASWLRSRPWVGDGARPTPTVLNGLLLQFHIYWQAEQQVLSTLKPRIRSDDPPAPLPEDFVQAAEQQQLDPEKLIQIQRARSQKVTFLSGGPGTGKTTTLTWLLAALLRQQPDLAIALAAPTGKAAQRMKEAMDRAIPALPLADEQKARLLAIAPSTLHRLLGISRRPQPRYHADNPLPAELIVVDEASMVDVLLLAKLVLALNENTRLILVGDPNQLTSVEAGNVLADLTKRFAQAHCHLKRSHRFNQTIGRLADTILEGDGDAAWQQLQAKNQDALGQMALKPSVILEAAKPGLEDYLQRMRAFTSTDYHSTAIQAREIMAALAHFRVLTPLRHHPQWGVTALNQHLIRHFARQGLRPLHAKEFYAGQPILIQENDYQLGLFNGDSGLILPFDGQVVVWFEEGEQMRAVPLSQLPAWETAYAMTVHKAQGAEFDEVVLVLPNEQTPVLTRELVYTALTRAKQRFTLAGSKEALIDAVRAATLRTTGLSGAVH